MFFASTKEQLERTPALNGCEIKRIPLNPRTQHKLFLNIFLTFPIIHFYDYICAVFFNYTSEPHLLVVSAYQQYLLSSNIKQTFSLFPLQIMDAEMALMLTVQTSPTQLTGGAVSIFSPSSLFVT